MQVYHPSPHLQSPLLSSEWSSLLSSLPVSSPLFQSTSSPSPSVQVSPIPSPLPFTHPFLYPSSSNITQPIAIAPQLSTTAMGGSNSVSPMTMPQQNHSPTYFFADTLQPYLFYPAGQFIQSCGSPSWSMQGAFLQPPRSPTPFDPLPQPTLAADRLSEQSGSAHSSPLKSASTGRSKLPLWCLAADGKISVDMETIVKREDLLETFAFEKKGCEFLQEQYAKTAPYIRRMLFNRIVGGDLFNALICDTSGNFLLQKMFEAGNTMEHMALAARLNGRMKSLSEDRCSCRVVQAAMSHLPETLRGPLTIELYGSEVELATGQNSTHVIQSIIEVCTPKTFNFIINAFVDDPLTFRRVVQDKYGCRAVQLAVEQLSGKDEGRLQREKLLSALLNDAECFIFNQYANYVMQQIIKDDALSQYRDHIIKQHILGHMISLSQDKFGSHVAEKALKYAPQHPTTLNGVLQEPLLDQLMNEVLNGFTHMTNGGMQNAVKTLMFDQFGNYVVQTMLAVASEFIDGDAPRCDWFKTLADHVATNYDRLMKYSSGKKIIEQMKSMLPYDESHAQAGKGYLPRFPPLPPAPYQ